MINIQPLLGTKKNMLTLIGEVEKKVFPSGKAHRKVLCLCDCGNRKIVGLSRFIHSRVKSCGCLVKMGARRTHEKSKSKIYTTWLNMKNRCYREKDIRFHRYGGRGIKVCNRWKHSFENFYDDMGDKPNGKTIDRVNLDGNYCKSNCRWATNTEQANNRSNNHMVEYKGKIDTIANWSKELSIDYFRTRDRLSAGWTPKKAFETPVRKHRPYRISI